MTKATAAQGKRRARTPRVSVEFWRIPCQPATDHEHTTRNAIRGIPRRGQGTSSGCCASSTACFVSKAPTYSTHSAVHHGSATVYKEWRAQRAAAKEDGACLRCVRHEHPPPQLPSHVESLFEEIAIDAEEHGGRPVWVRCRGQMHKHT